MARTKGAKNNVTGDCKTSIMGVYEALGGAEAMLKWAQQNQTDYYRMLVQILPKEQVKDPTNPFAMLSATDVIDLIISLARSRGFAIPSTIEQYSKTQARALPTLSEAN